jgi:hypothetical protein
VILAALPLYVIWKVLVVAYRGSGWKDTVSILLAVFIWGCVFWEGRQHRLSERDQDQPRASDHRS